MHTHTHTRASFRFTNPMKNEQLSEYDLLKFSTLL